MRHPRTIGEKEVVAFLTHLVVKDRVSASTQNQALAALLFLYRDVFREPLPWLNRAIGPEAAIGDEEMQVRVPVRT